MRTCSSCRAVSCVRRSLSLKHVAVGAGGGASGSALCDGTIPAAWATAAAAALAAKLSSTPSLGLASARREARCTCTPVNVSVGGRTRVALVVMVVSESGRVSSERVLGGGRGEMSEVRAGGAQRYAPHVWRVLSSPWSPRRAAPVFAATAPSRRRAAGWRSRCACAATPSAPPGATWRAAATACESRRGV
jgi:hypothetical protein